MNTEKGKAKKYGNVYEIILPNNKYIYVCWIGESHFGFFNYYSEEATTDLNLEKKQLLQKRSGN